MENEVLVKDFKQIDLDYLDFLPIEEVCKYLQEQCTPEMINPRFSVNYDYDYIDAGITFERKENEKEKARRLREEEKARIKREKEAEKQKERERKEYERLKKIYG